MQVQARGRRLSRRAVVGGLTGLGVSMAGLALVGGCGVVLPRTPSRVPRIGYLSPGPREAFAYQVDSFVDGLNALGYVEEQTIAIEWRFTPEGQANQFAELAAELVRMNVAVIVTESSTPATAAAQKATTKIPIVASNVVNPVQTGLVASLARPGGNVTAIASSIPGLAGKSVELLKELMPHLEHLTSLREPGSASSVTSSADLQTAADRAGLHLEQVDLDTANDLEPALSLVARSGAEAVVNNAGALLLPVRTRLADLLLQYRLPGVDKNRPFAAAGTLMSYGPSLGANARRAAVYVDKILKGAKPADLPVEQATAFEFVVNVKTAAALGLAFPPDVAAQVTEWIN